VVRAPLRASDKQIQELVQNKAKWIVAKQEEMRRTYAAMRAKEYTNGEAFLYLGKPLQAGYRRRQTGQTSRLATSSTWQNLLCRAPKQCSKPGTGSRRVGSSLSE